MSRISFAKGQWSMDDFMYVYSPNCQTYSVFLQGEDQILNRTEGDKDFEYISIISKKKYSVGTTITTECSFDHFGAPLIVLTDDLNEDGGITRYGLHFEVVAYDHGCNIWHIVPNIPSYTKDRPGTPGRRIRPTKILHEEFAIADGERCTLSVTLGEHRLDCVLNGVSFSVENEDLPLQAHLGITACEGINRFYSLEISD